MPEQVAAETPRATSTATNLREFQAAKAAPAAETTPKPEEKKPTPSEQTGKPESGSAAASEAPNQETQDKGKKDRSAEGRAAELSAQGRYDEALKILQAKDRKRDEEFAELRRKLENPQAPSKPAAEPEPKPTAAASDKPKLKDYLARPENKDKAYDDVVEQWEESVADWRENKRKAETAQETHTRTVNEKIAEGRAKHGAGFDAALKVQLHNSNLQALVHEFDNGMDVLMALHEDPAEHQRIFALTPARQLVELGYIARDLKAEAKAAEKPRSTEKPQPPPVSQIRPPARSLGGTAPSETQHKTPTSLAEHRANRAAK